MKKLSFIFIFSLTFLASAGFLAGKLLISDRLTPYQLGYNGLRHLKKVDWLFLGPSRIDAGYDMKLIEDNLSGTAYAIWLPNLNPREIQLYLRQIQRDGFEIKNLVIDMPPIVFGIPPEISSTRVFYEAPPQLKKEIFEYYVSQPSISKEHLFNLILGGFSTDMFLFLINRPFIDDASYHGIRKSLKRSLSSKEWENLKVKKRFIASEGKVLPLYKEALLETMKELKASFKGNVYFVDTALARVAHDHPFIQSLTKEVSGMIKAEGMTYINTADLGFDIDSPEMFYDDHHFSKKGRTLNTMLFADFIKSKR